VLRGRNSGLEGVVTYRRIEDIVIGRGRAANAFKSVALEVFVLRAERNTTEMALVEILPETHGEFGEALVVGDAGWRCAGAEARRRRDRTTRVVEGGIAETEIVEKFCVGLFDATISVDVQAFSRM